LGSDTPNSIAAALSQLAGDPALRREMGENGARAFAANTPDNFARPIVEAIKRVVSAAC
jgi:glycosyltransferase involved in cell wall biosynthesis